jgi:hypothetical protein
MLKRILPAFVLLLLGCPFLMAQAPPPEQVMVPDAKTAIALATVILKANLGEDGYEGLVRDLPLIRGSPFQAQLDEDEWYVVDNMPRGPRLSPDGKTEDIDVGIEIGSVTVIIAKRDGQVRDVIIGDACPRDGLIGWPCTRDFALSPDKEKFGRWQHLKR